MQICGSEEEQDAVEQVECFGNVFTENICVTAAF